DWKRIARAGSATDPVTFEVSFSVFPTCDFAAYNGTVGPYNDFSRSAAGVAWTARCWLDDGVNLIANAGGHAARVLITPRGCGHGPRESLADVLSSADVMAALDNPAIDDYLLTVFDTAGCDVTPRKTYLDPTLYTPAYVDALKEEYRAFTRR